MFTNLIESRSHRREFKRRGSFFLITVAAYAVILFAAGIASIYAYDAQLEAQSDTLELLNWVPPVTPVQNHDRPRPAARPAVSTGRRPSESVRPILYENPASPIKPPDTISSAPNPIPPATPFSRIGDTVSEPVGPSVTAPCATCNGTATPPVVHVDETKPTPKPESDPPKPTTERVPSTVLRSMALSLPQPPYPSMARQIHVFGQVQVQILVDENGKVVSAQAVTGHPLLVTAAKDAAMRARFTPTKLNGVPVKIQGVITYNFVLQ